ncbi:MAG: hypothetical protein WCI73_02240, partial [Phycisphaerae bacterium]
MMFHRRTCGVALCLATVLGGAAGYSLWAASPTSRSAPAAATQPADLGVGASLHGNRLLPTDNPWNQDISRAAVDPDSAKLVGSIGPTKSLHPDFGVKYGI